MKTKFLTLIALAGLTLTTTSATFANAKPNHEITMLKGIDRIIGIEANGNVEVHITSGNKDAVKVYDSYYGQNALVQNENGVLRITSYNTEKLVVEVTVTDLRSIKASESAMIKSFGRLSVLQLAVELNDNAGAKLNIDALAARFNIRDRARADISGTIEDYELNYSRSSTVNRTYLVAANRTETISAPMPQVTPAMVDTLNIASL